MLSRRRPMLIPNDTFVLVGDGRKALFLRNRGGAGHPELVTEAVMEQDNPATREQGTDRPGRYGGPDGVSKSAVEETDWHQQAEDRFASEVADALFWFSLVLCFLFFFVVVLLCSLGLL